MKRVIPWAGAVAVALVLAWWLVAGHGGETATVVGPAPSETAVDAALPLPATPVPARVPLELVLLADGRISALPGSVRIALGYVSPEDAASWSDAEVDGAGPTTLAELATIDRWITAPATLQDDGSVRVGPLDLPRADRYDLQARAGDGLRFHAATFTAANVPAQVKPTVAAGLRIVRDGDDAASALLRRVGEQRDAAMWQSLLQVEAPTLLAAFDESPLPLERVAQFAPLPPGPIDVVLQVADIEAARQSTTLIAGTFVEVRFTALDEDVARAVSTRLELEFVDHAGGAPVPDLRVTWLGERGETMRVSDAGGVAAFDGVDRQRAAHFNLQMPASTSTLPEWPELRAIEVDLAEEDGDVVRRRIELSRFEWLIVRSGSIAIDARRGVGSPYPIFVLQRQEDEAWRDVAADHFLPVPEGLAVSITEPATLRLAAALTPWTVLHSTSADTGARDADGRYVVDLAPASGHRVELTVLRDGAALGNAPLHVRGPLRRLPPQSMTTDHAGRLVLDDVTVSSLTIEVAGFDEQAVDVSSQVATVRLLTASAEPGRRR